MILSSPPHGYLFSHQINVRVDDLNYGNHLCHSKLIHMIHEVIINES